MSVTGSAELEQVKDMYCEEGGKINMCEAIRGMIEDGRIEGVNRDLNRELDKGLARLWRYVRSLGFQKKMWFPRPRKNFPCLWMRWRI